MESSQPLATPKSTANTIPAGHVVVNSKWRGTELARSLQSKINVLYEEDGSVVDFYPSTGSAIVYITEGDLVAGNMYRRRLAKLRKASNLRGIVLVEKTKTSSQYFQPVQKFAVQEIGLVLLPVENQEQAAGLIAQMAQVEQRNPFLVKLKSEQQDIALLATVRTIPRLGEVKAQALLQAFHSIQGICQASENDLARVVGKNIASKIKEFFHSPP